jgi:hypothetical protein
VLDGGASGIEYVTGWAWFRPLFVHDKLCLAQQLIQRAHRTASGYDWQPKRNEFRYWKASAASDCEVDDASMIPSDAILGQSGDLSDMIVGEVKEGRARLNDRARDPSVLRAALVRFGCCAPHEAGDIVKDDLDLLGLAT